MRGLDPLAKTQKLAHEQSKPTAINFSCRSLNLHFSNINLFHNLLKRSNSTTINSCVCPVTRFGRWGRY